MATRVTNQPAHTIHTIFHHGLAKLLVLTELRKQNYSWKHFLFCSGYGPENHKAQGNLDTQISKKETKTYVNKHKSPHIRRKIQEGQGTSRGQKRKVEQEAKKAEKESNSKDEHVPKLLIQENLQRGRASYVTKWIYIFPKDSQ